MKPSVPKGTRDFSPEQVFKRNYIFNTIRKVFENYGYRPIETPTMENLATLTGKYGNEGDKLLFKVLNNGDFLSKANEEALQAKDSIKVLPSISKRGLRYDLTVPFARYVVMHQNDIAFPFKRYQIQPVWRADRPQKGRYQEFYQCDADVVGSDSLLYEAELLQIYDRVFADLGVEVQIRLNNRKILAGIAEIAGIADRMVDMTVAIDKLDKIGMDGVRQEMEKRGISMQAIEKVVKLLGSATLENLKQQLEDSSIGQQGVAELEDVLSMTRPDNCSNEVLFDITLARGLNYYTGCIFEITTDAVKIGSLGGGGRYDDLTGIFGLKNVSGVGISFGAARIFDVLEELNLFPSQQENNIQVLFVAFNKATLQFAFECVTKVREAGIKADIYPDPGKLKKQMKYADARGVPYVALVGESELESGTTTFKDMKSGEQETLTIELLIQRLQQGSLMSEVTS